MNARDRPRENDVRIRYLVPLPYTSPQGVALRAEQIPKHILRADTEVVCVPIKNTIVTIDGYYGDLVLDMYMTEAGLRAEEEGYDAVAIDTMSDSAMLPLRSRLTIPVVGPGVVSYALATMLGLRFSVITMWDRWAHLYKRGLQSAGLAHKCASVRSVNIPPDVEALFTGKEEEMFAKLEAEARKAIEEDGADIILLGSTTMHQAGEYLNEHLPAPVINPGPLVIKYAEMLVELGLSHSKAAYPSPASLQDDRFFSLPKAEA